MSDDFVKIIFTFAAYWNVRCKQAKASSRDYCIEKNMQPENLVLKEDYLDGKCIFARTKVIQKW